MTAARHFSEETFGCASAAGLVQDEIKCLAGRVKGSVQIHPLATDFDIGLVNSPRIFGLLQVWATAFIQFWCIALNSTVDSGVVQGQTSLRHHFLQISVAERVSQVPSNTQ